MNPTLDIGETVIVRSPYTLTNLMNGFEGTVKDYAPECGVMFYVVELEDGRVHEFGHTELFRPSEYELNHMRDTYEVD